MHDDDAERVRRCLAGDTGAFEALVLRHQDAVFNLAWRMTGNWHDARDVTQDAFIRAFRKLATYRPEFAFRNWVMGIGANLARNRLRSGQRRRGMEERLAQRMDGADPPAPPAPGSDEELNAALGRIPLKLRAALVMKHAEGLSYEEVARALHIGVSAAKMRVARGRDALVELLGKRKETST